MTTNPRTSASGRLGGACIGRGLGSFGRLGLGGAQGSVDFLFAQEKGME